MNTKLLLVFLLLNVAILGQDCAQQYADFLNTQGRQPDTDPLKLQQRQQLFCTRLQQINDHNANNPNYTLAVNQFTDQLPEERNNFLKIGIDPSSVAPAASSSHLKRVGNAVGTAPLSLDWNAQGKVTPIKNQGNCGSCWVFTTVGVYQAYLKVKGFDTYDLSEEFILQCSTTLTSAANPSDCTGGYVSDALTVTENHGIPQQTAFPYTAGSYGSVAGYPSTVPDCTANTISYVSFQNLQTQKLGAGATFNQTTLTGYYNMTASDLKTLLVDSPVGALINADSGFMSYSSGVYSGCPADFATSRSAINHAVIIVGYDSSGNWIIKNSWGTGWGQSGFATISVTNDCALTAYVYQLTWQFRTTIYGLMVVLLAGMLIF